MIVKTGEADRFVTHPPRTLAAALVFGPDQGMVRERAERLVKTVVPDLTDPFRIAELDDQTLASDGARLFDEAASIAMLGGRRVVRVRGAGNALAKLFEAFLEDHAGDALVVVEAGELTKGVGLRRVFEEDESAAAIACYSDSARDLSDLVRDALKQEGFEIAPDALADAAARLGQDRGVTRSELDKLMLYAQGSKKITLDDVRAILGEEGEAEVEEVCDAAGAGDMAALDRALERLWVSGTSPVAIVRIALMHFHKLALARSLVDGGEAVDSAMRRLRPPIHFMRTTAFKTQLQKWSANRLGDALDLLLETEFLCKTTAVPAEAACGRALFNIAAMARAKG